MACFVQVYGFCYCLWSVFHLPEAIVFCKSLVEFHAFPSLLLSSLIVPPAIACYTIHPFTKGHFVLSIYITEIFIESAIYKCPEDFGESSVNALAPELHAACILQILS